MKRQQIIYNITSTQHSLHTMYNLDIINYHFGYTDVELRILILKIIVPVHQLING